MLNFNKKNIDTSKCYTFLSMLFVSLFLVSNLIAQKLVSFNNGLVLTAGDIVYPINYIISMILTEVYGYNMSRRVIWSAFICGLFSSFIFTMSVLLPSANCWYEQNHFAFVFGKAPRILFSSLFAFLIGEFIGSYILAKIKVVTLGKYLWLRSLCATLVGQIIDGTSFNIFAFFGIISWHNIIVLSFSSYSCKLLYQIILMPLIYIIVKFIKKYEQIDIFDNNTNFNPFNLKK